MFTISIAGLPVGIDNCFGQIHIHSERYITEETPLFTVSVSPEELERERAADPKNASLRRGSIEEICLYRHIAAKLPEYDAFVMHGAAISKDGRGVLFTAPSGTGKSTHIALWQQRYPETEIINGDKPVLRRMEDGLFYICGTPWNGKEYLGNPVMRPAAAVCLLERGAENRIRRITVSEALPELFRQVYFPVSAEYRERFLPLLSSFLSAVPLYRLACNMDVSAAGTACSGIFGE